MDQHVNARTAAAYLGVVEMTVLRWCRSGKLAGAYLPKRSRRLGWRIPLTSVHSLLEVQERETLQDRVSA
jgi:excisionase family DNA binding protein